MSLFVFVLLQLTMACCCMLLLPLLLLLLQVAAMGELIQAGKVKHWGLSNETTFGEQNKKNSW
jgi:diketogulonate reductase-like aldo/keto reductase